MLLKKYKELSSAQARDFLSTLHPDDPESYLTDLINAHHEALADAQDLITTRGWTRGEVLAFCTAMYDSDVYPHEDCSQRLALILDDASRVKVADPLVEDPDTWCDRCDEIARDRLLGVALVNVWRAWRFNKDGPIGRWINTLTLMAPRRADVPKMGPRNG